MDELSRFEVDDDEEVVTEKPEIADLDEIAGAYSGHADQPFRLMPIAHSG